MAVGKKVGGLIDQYQNKISGKSGSDTKPSLPKQDRALAVLQEGGIRDLSKSSRNRI